MKIVGFHLMPYRHLPSDFEHRYRSVWVDIPPGLFDPERGAAAYHEYLTTLESMDTLGFDGIGVNEHHQNAYGTMPSPNLIGSILARNTSRAALVVLGDSLALYNPPLRVAEEFYLHGAGGPLGGWAPFLDGLAEHFRVYAPVHPGYGKSTGLEQIDSALEMGFYYLDWLDAMGLGEVCLVGHSMGGLIAAEMASIAPHRVGRLVLANAAGFWLDDAPIPDFFVMTPRESREVLFHDASSPLALMMLPDTPPPPEVLLEVLGAYASSAKLLWPLPSDPALLKRLHRLTMPTLVLWGASDRLIPPAHARAWERALADARVVILPESGHLPMYEQPEAWVREVLEFGGKPTAAMASA